MSIDTIASTLHFDACGCATWADIDGVHIFSCNDPEHEAFMHDAVRHVSRTIGLDLNVISHTVLPANVFKAMTDPRRRPFIREDAIWR